MQRGSGRCDTTQVAAALGPRQCQCRVVPVQSSASAEQCQCRVGGEGHSDQTNVMMVAVARRDFSIQCFCELSLPSFD